MLFEKTLEKTGQVIIMVRSMPNSRDDSNPFDFETSKEKNRTEALTNYQGTCMIL
jgi:hypothetical protein